MQNGVGKTARGEIRDAVCRFTGNVPNSGILAHGIVYTPRF